MDKYEEALKAICFGCNDYVICTIGGCELKNCKIMKELIDKQETYRWHDLRKDPNDLPKKNGEYLVVLLPSDKNYLFRKYSLVIYSDLMGICNEKHWHNDRVGSDDYENYDERVIAWKNIEEFEND